MLRHSFIHLPRVGVATELALWNAGIATWEDFLGAASLPARVRRRQTELCAHLEECCARLAAADASFFHHCLPSSERWRLYRDFRERAAFLDIETTGGSAGFGYITMVGILDSQGYRAYIEGENLDDLRAALEQYDLIVTYNGAAFDLPYIEYFFGRVFAHKAHLDLLVPLRRLGYRGGLKAIERQLHVGRPSDLQGLDGYDAVLLWRMWRRGNTGALETLVRYNAEDVASLPALADIVYRELSGRLPVPCQQLAPWPRPVIDLPYDMDVVQRLKRLRFLSER